MYTPSRSLHAVLFVFWFIIGEVVSKCPNGQLYVESDCKCLQLFKEQVYWPSAESRCGGRGGSLVTIRSADKYDAVKKLVTKSTFTYNGVWIGLRYYASTQDFRWADTREPVSVVSYWGDGEPDLSTQECVMVHRSRDWKWRDFWCGVEPYSYICEYDSKECGEPKENNLPGNIFAGIVVGSIVGFILLMVALFLIINCVRQVLSNKKKTQSQNRVVMSELQQREDNFNITEEQNNLVDTNLPPPDYFTVVNAEADVECNNLDNSTKKKGSYRLPSANLVSADSMKEKKTPKRNESVKILNSPVTPGHTSHTPQRLNRQTSTASVEDNTTNT